MYFKYTYYLDPNFSVYTKDTFNLYSYVPIKAQNIEFQIKNNQSLHTLHIMQSNQNNQNNQNNIQIQNNVKEYEKYEKYEKVPINILKLDFTDLNVGSPEYIPGKVWSPVSSNTSSPVSSNTPSPNISPRKHITVYENKQSSPRRYYHTYRRRN